MYYVALIIFYQRGIKLVIDRYAFILFYENVRPYVSRRGVVC